MNVIYFKEAGKPEDVLSIGQIPMPEPVMDEVLIRILASPINPADFLFIGGKYRIQPVFPQIAGFEGAGIIVDNGGDKDYPINTLVAFRHKNAWAEYVNVPKNKIILLPENLPVEKATQLSLNPLTAWALLDELNAAAGEWVLLSAGNSAVSKLIMQFAKTRDLKTIAIVREGDRFDELLSLGASVVLKANDGDLERRIKAVVQEDKIAGFLDAVGGELASRVIKIITANSKIIHYGLFSDQNVIYHSADIIFRNIVIMGFGIDGWISTKTAADLVRTWEQIIQEVMNPGFRMDVAGKYALEEFEKAISENRFAKGGKIIFWIK
jgi:NADPH2:quinone reductase